MQCPRCLNSDPSFFALGSRGMYCRACIRFKRQLIEEEIHIADKEPLSLDSDYDLGFDLTPQQQSISTKLCHVSLSCDVLVYAVCGAGKTEIILQCLADRMAKGQRVAVAIARRQVVLELTQRFKQYFKHLKVIAVCQGYTDETEADLIVCTTHQLYRYFQTFDLLVLDEPDAFPYKNDPVLQGIARTSCCGQIVYLTATPDDQLKKAVAENRCCLLSLLHRPHKQPLIVPQVTIRPDGVGLLILLQWLYAKNQIKRQALVFVPTITLCTLLSKILGLFFSVCRCSSKTPNRDQVIESFRNGIYRFCICTSILERGVTFKGIDVAVWRADHIVFDEAALVQIAGRTGRSMNDPSGDCLFLCRKQKEAIEQCIERIQDANADLSVLRM